MLNECCICLYVIKTQDSFTLLECNHTLHKDCITLLLTNSECKPLRCPYCRKNLDKFMLRSAIFSETNKDLKNSKETISGVHKVVNIKSNLNCFFHFNIFKSKNRSYNLFAVAENESRQCTSAIPLPTKLLKKLL